MSEDVRLSKYLHKPWMLIFFEMQEWAIIVVSIFIAMIAQHLVWYLGIVVFPYVFIPILRKAERGVLAHTLSMGKFVKFTGYPPLFVREFHE